MRKNNEKKQFALKNKQMIKKTILCAIKGYQVFISPFLRKSCRFYPSCSSYAYASVLNYGIIKGLGKGLKRILKCHPFNSGGVDLP